MRRLKTFIGITLIAQSLTVPAAACWGDGCGGRFPPGMNIQLLRSRLRSEAQVPPPSKGVAPPKAEKAKDSEKKEKQKKAPAEKTPSSPRR